MDVNGSDAYRVNYSTRAKDIIDKADLNNFFDLKAIYRSDLFLFAMALGMTKGPTLIQKNYPGGLFREASLDPKTRAIMYALFIDHFNISEDDLDKISNKKEVFETAERYANTGFEVLGEVLEKHKGNFVEAAEQFAWELISQTNDLCDEIMYKEISNEADKKAAEEANRKG